MTADRRVVLAEVALLAAGACTLAAKMPNQQQATLAAVAAVGLLIAALWQRGSALKSPAGRAAMAAGLCLLIWPATVPPAATSLRMVSSALLLLALLSVLLRRRQRRPGLSSYAYAVMVVTIVICVLAALMFFALRTRYNLDPGLLRETTIQTITYTLAFVAATLAFAPRDGFIIAVILLTKALLSLKGWG